MLLVLNRGNKISNEQLMEALWEPDELENPAGALKNAAYSLRKSLQGALPRSRPRGDPGRQYCWNPRRPWSWMWSTLPSFTTRPPRTGRRTSGWNCAARPWRFIPGTLPGLGDRHWVIPRASALRQQYLDLTIIAAGLLLARHTKAAAEEALALCNRAVLTEPLDEDLYLRQFTAMQQLGMKNAVLKYYPVVANLFFDELGEPLPAPLRTIYQWASESSNPAVDDILHIQKDLDEATRDSRPIRGAYFCQYEVFKHMYHMVVRSAARSGGCVALFLMTFLPVRGQTVPKEELTGLMLAMKEEIQKVLRKGDVFSRYSRNQYVLMLSVRSIEDSGVVAEPAAGGVPQGARPHPSHGCDRGAAGVDCVKKCRFAEKNRPPFPKPGTGACLRG